MPVSSRQSSVRAEWVVRGLLALAVVMACVAYVLFLRFPASPIPGMMAGDAVVIAIGALYFWHAAQRKRETSPDE